VDSEKLLQEINRQAEKQQRRIRVLLQIHIAQEEHKFGFSQEEAEALAQQSASQPYPWVDIRGLMGMATYTDNRDQIKQEFTGLHTFFLHLKAHYFTENTHFKECSMGMSEDYPLAMEAGSTLVRIGSKIFGNRT
jgi:pyridoxal phosphate enzyme (YggS family)